MKKLNTLVSAISLGLTLSFAALPVVSAHPTLDVGHSHTVHMYQKYTSKDSRKPYQELYRHRPVNPCEKATIWPIPGPGGSGFVTLTTAVSAGTKVTGPAITVTSFVAPSDCANTFEASVSWTPNLTDNNSTAPVELTCQWFEDGAPVGQQFVDNSPEEFSQFSNTASASTPTIFSTNVYAPPQPTLYGDGYGYGRPRLATFTLNCMQTVFSFVGGTATSKIQVSGNDTAGLAGPQVYQSVDQYSEDNSYPGYSARHHVKVK